MTIVLTLRAKLVSQHCIFDLKKTRQWVIKDIGRAMGKMSTSQLLTCPLIVSMVDDVETAAFVLRRTFVSMDDYVVTAESVHLQSIVSMVDIVETAAFVHRTFVSMVDIVETAAFVLHRTFVSIDADVTAAESVHLQSIVSIIVETAAFVFHKTFVSMDADVVPAVFVGTGYVQDWHAQYFQ